MRRDEVSRHAVAPRQALHLGRQGTAARTDRIERLERGAAGIASFQPGNGLFGIIPRGHHHVLQAATQGHLNGHFELGRDVDQFGDRPQHARYLAFPAGNRDRLDSREEPRPALMHAAQYFEPCVGISSRVT